MTAVPVLRQLRPSDLTRVIALERSVFPAPWSLAMFALELSKRDGICIAADVEGELVGYGICTRYDTVWHIMNVCVATAHRRHRVGSHILETIVQRAGADARLTLEVRPSNAAGIALYEGHGFLPAGYRRRYYADNGEDAIIMWRTPATLNGNLDDVPNAEPLSR